MAGTDNPLVSVVVPVYNVEKYVDSCVESIINQTYTHLEIILVDDGSTDGSVHKCNAWAKKDDRIKVLHKRNEGLNFARRDGLRASTGEWISFVDSDDIVHPDLVNDLLHTALETKTDIVAAQNQKFTKEDDIVLEDNKNSHKKLLIRDKAKLMRYVFVKSPDEKVFMITAWCKLFRRSVLETIDWKLSNSRANEDELEAIQYYNMQKNGVAVIKKILYFYRDNPSSIMNKAYANSYRQKSYSRFEWIEELYNVTIKFFGKNLYADEMLYHNVMLNLLFLNKDLARGTFTDKDYQAFSNYFYPKIDQYKNISKKYPLSHEEKRAFDNIAGSNLFMLWTADRHLIDMQRSDSIVLRDDINRLHHENDKLRQYNKALIQESEQVNSKLESYLSIKKSMRLLLENVKRRLNYGRNR